MNSNLTRLLPRLTPTPASIRTLLRSNPVHPYSPGVVTTQRASIAPQGPAFCFARATYHIHVRRFCRKLPRLAFDRACYPALSNSHIHTEALGAYPDAPLRSNVGSSLIVFVVIATAGYAISFIWREDRIEEASNTSEQLNETAGDMAVPNPPGRPGNLTPEQEEKLRKLWVAVFQTTGVKGSDPPQVEAPELAEAESETPKKKRFGLFRKEGKSKTASGTETPPKDATEEDKYGQTAKYHETLANHSPESIRETIWTMVKHDHPDALVLRFLRARKWDVEKALVMLVSTMNWRQTEMHLDDDIMKKGEGGAVDDEQHATDEKLKTVGHDFMEQIRMGKSFLHGKDKEGRPICYVRVRLHKQGEQCEESLERYTVYLIETARMVLSPPVDTATIVFDMTGFSMANMDYTPVKFMIKCFEANYPESLGTVLINNAPWVFQGIWKIIKGWLDPVVASKVHFTNNRNDISEFIAPGQILKELGGDEDWEYKYVEPIPGENEKMKDTETRDRLLRTREEIVKEFEAETLKWIKTPEGEEGKKIMARRDELAAKLKQDYWNLDPYVRARSVYDRTGALKQDGTVEWYVAAKQEAANGTAAHATSPDDVD